MCVHVCACAAGGTPAAVISRAVFIDREVDLVTPMMTQITFEGLIDEVTGIKYGAVHIKGARGSAHQRCEGQCTSKVRDASGQRQ